MFSKTPFYFFNGRYRLLFLSCPSHNGEDSRAPALCLICGDMICSQSYCCQAEVNGNIVGAATSHAHHCGSGIGMFLRFHHIPSLPSFHHIPSLLFFLSIFLTFLSFFVNCFINSFPLINLFFILSSLDRLYFCSIHIL